MPSAAIEISGEQRQPLHRLVTQHISGIGHVYLVIEHGDFATAERFFIGDDRRLQRALRDAGEDLPYRRPPRGSTEAAARRRRLLPRRTGST